MFELQCFLDTLVSFCVDYLFVRVENHRLLLREHRRLIDCSWYFVEFCTQSKVLKCEYHNVNAGESESLN